MLWDTDETLSELFIDGEIRVFLPFSGRFLINSVEFTKIFRFSREFVEQWVSDSRLHVRIPHFLPQDVSGN